MDVGQRKTKGQRQMTTKFDSKDSFIRGYNFGSFQKRELTNREIETNFPDVELESFVQGMLDGIEGDRFRLDLTLGQLSLS